MRKTINLIFISFLLIALVQSCCKKPKIPTYYMPQEFKDYVDFPVGSWWVYEDSVTKKLDTVSLINSATDIIPKSKSTIIQIKKYNFWRDFTPAKNTKF